MFFETKTEFNECSSQYFWTNLWHWNNIPKCTLFESNSSKMKPTSIWKFSFLNKNINFTGLDAREKPTKNRKRIDNINEKMEGGREFIISFRFYILGLWHLRTCPNFRDNNRDKLEKLNRVINWTTPILPFFRLFSILLRLFPSVKTRLDYYYEPSMRGRTTDTKYHRKYNTWCSIHYFNHLLLTAHLQYKQSDSLWIILPSNHFQWSIKSDIGQNNSILS